MRWIANDRFPWLLRKKMEHIYGTRNTEDDDSEVTIYQKHLRNANDDVIKSEWSNSFKRFEGIFCATLGGFFSAAVAVIYKFMKDFNAIELSFYRSLGLAILSAPLVILRLGSLRDLIKKKIIFLLVVNSLLIFLITIARILAYQKMPLGDACSIIFNTPIFTAIFARIILKEHVKRLTTIALVISVIGMVLTLKLPMFLESSERLEETNLNDHLVGSACAIFATVFAALRMVVLRTLKSVDAEVTTLVQGLLGMFLAICICPIFGGWSSLPCTLASWGIVSICFTSFLMQFFISRSLQKEMAAVASTVYRSSDILLAFVLQVVLFREAVDIFSALGAVLIVGSGFLMPLQKWMESLRDGHKFKITQLLQ